MESESEQGNNSPNSNRNLLLVLIGLVGVLIVVGIAFLVLSLVRDGSSSEAEPTPTAIAMPTVETPEQQPTAVPPAPPESSPTPPPVIIPTPEPQNPTGRVTAPNGLNIRTGPGEVYPVIGVAPFGAEGLITGRSADEQWWVVFVPSAPNSQAWASAQFVAATNAENVPIIPAPPTPTPAATATPVATPTPTLIFTADRTTINQGECTTLRWSVENIQAVWVYPLGQPYQNFPVTGQGSRQECPPQTTTYEMRVQQLDGSFVFQQLTITVIITNPLANTSWQLVNLNMDALPVPGTIISITFNGDGTLNTNGGCNNFTAPYSVSGNNIIVGSLSGTMMTCSEALNQQERAYTIALNAAATYELVGNQLIIRNTAGQEVLRYNRTG